MNKAKILEYITDLENQNELLQDNIYNLQDRIDKAIEYIHKQTTDEDTGKNLGYSDNIDDEYLIKILKGDNK